MEKLLILDLDETLIYATKNPIEIQEDFQWEDYYVYQRPNLEQFLISASQHFKIGIWSSADDIYVQHIVEKIKPKQVDVEIVWGRSKCSRRLNKLFDEYYYEKRLDKLTKLGFAIEHILIVDDTPEKSRTNYGNAITISEFTGDKKDEDLLFLENYLTQLKNENNFRTIEKRFWRQK